MEPLGTYKDKEFDQTIDFIFVAPLSEYSLLKPYYPYKWCLLILTSLLNINPLYECPPKKKLPGHLIERENTL